MSVVISLLTSVRCDKSLAACRWIVKHSLCFSWLTAILPIYPGLEHALVLLASICILWIHPMGIKQWLQIRWLSSNQELYDADNFRISRTDLIWNSMCRQSGYNAYLIHRDISSLVLAENKWRFSKSRIWKLLGLFCRSFSTSWTFKSWKWIIHHKTWFHYQKIHFNHFLKLRRRPKSSNLIWTNF